MRKSLGKEALIFTLVFAGCSATARLNGAHGKAGFSPPTPEPTPTFEPTPVPLSEQTIERLAGDNFLMLLNRMEASENSTIRLLPKKLYGLQDTGSIGLYTSKPEFDAEGRVAKDSRTPMKCGLDNSGKYIILVNTNAYFFDDTFSLEITAAHIDTCVTVYEELGKKYAEFSKKYPGSDFLDAMREHPEWLDSATSQAWFLATRDILIPNKDKVKEENGFYGQLIDIYERSEGDFAKWDEEMHKPTEAPPSYQI